MTMPPNSVGPLDELDSVAALIWREKAIELLRESERLILIGEWIPNTTHEDVARRIREFLGPQSPTSDGRTP